MGVVRRKDSWRLEKQEEGVYVITYDHDIEAKVVTKDYTPGMFDERYDVTAPVHEVDSFADAEELLDDFAASGSPTSLGGFGSISDQGAGTELSYDDSLGSGEDSPNLPPGGIAAVLLIAGGISLYTFGFAADSIPSLFALGMVSFGLLIVGWGVVVYRNDGARAALEFFLIAGDEKSESEKTDSSDDRQEKTPPTPQSLKDDLYFDRASQGCEWCDNRTDQPEVHHITPRSEGGPNEPSNLIVLCPGCHAKADRGAISRTKLRSKVRRIADSVRS